MAHKHGDIGVSVEAVADINTLELVDPQLTTELRGIRVFDVGQGDCIGLLDQSDSVFCYVDYGGLNDHPDVKNPRATASRLPVRLDGRLVSIILTHWDKDHYYSAAKKNPLAQDCEWLVPRQIASPQAVRFAANLPNAKCWPEARGDEQLRIGIGVGHDIEIRKCRPFDPTAIKEDRNTSGLAVTLLRWNSTTVVRVMILPGDCPFDLIPQMPDAPIRSLVAYHHGSHVGWTNATTQAISRTARRYSMAYSFGRNTFGHPQRMNYRPRWDSCSVSTKMLRTQGLKYKDFYW